MSEIDNLSIQISAETTRAVTDITRLRAHIGKLSTALSDISSKPFKINIDMSAVKTLSDMQSAAQKAFANVKGDMGKIGEELAKSFNVDKAAAKNISKQFTDIVQQAADNFDGKKLSFGNNFENAMQGVVDSITRNGSVARAEIKSTLLGVEEEYKDFINYFNKHKIYVSDYLKADIGKSEFSDILNSNLRNITRQKGEGVDVNADWAELQGRFPTILPPDINNAVDQVTTVLQKIREIREELGQVSFQNLSGKDLSKQQEMMIDSFLDSADKAYVKLNAEIEKVNKETTGFTPTVNINEEGIVSQIQSAVRKAAKVEYEPLKINLKVDAEKINANLKEVLKGLDFGGLDRFETLSNSVKSIANLNIKDTGITNLVNALNRLQQASNINFDTSKFDSMLNSVKKIAEMPDVSARVSSFVASIARLANAGDKVGVVATQLPTLGASLKRVIQDMVGMPSVSDGVNMFTQSIAQIANAGDRAAKTAANLQKLGDGLMSLFNTLSRAPQISNSTIQMTQALANLAAQGGRVGTASRSIVGGINNASKAMKNARGNVLNFAAAFGRLYATWWAAIRGIKGWMASVEGTTDYIESFNYATVAFGKIASEFDENWKSYGSEGARNYSNAFVKGMSEMSSKLSGLKIEFSPDFSEGLLSESGLKNLGLNIQEVTQYAAQLASVTNSIGLTGKTSLAASTAFTKLAGDISSLFNIKYKDAAQNIQSGLIGQSRAMYKYGIDITNATLQTYAYNLGIDKQIAKMTQAEKMQLRMIAILNQSRVSWGDLSNTINSPNNMLKQFTNNVRELSMVFGQLFIPILSKVMPIVNGVVIAIKRLMVSVANLLGIKLDFSSFGAGYNQLEDGLDGIADGYENVADAAKKARTTTLAIDELNINSGDEDGGSGAGAGVGGGFDLTDEILQAAADYDKVWQEAFDNMQNKAQEWAGKVETALEPVKKIFEDLSNGNFRGAGEKFGNLLNGLISPTTFGNFGEKVAQGINNAVQFALGMGYTFDFANLGSSLAAAANRFFAKLDTKSLAEAINVWVRGALKTVHTFFKETDFYMIGTKIGEFLKNIKWLSILADVGKVIWDALNAALQTWAGMLSVAPLETALITLIAFPTLLKAITSSEIITGLANLANGFYLVTTGLGGNLTSIQKLTDLYPALGGAVSVAKQAFAEFVSGLNTGGLFEGLQQGTQTISNSLNGVQKAAIAAVAGFAEFYIVSNAVENLTLGTGNFLAEIAKIAGAVTVAGIAFSSVFGFPAGLIVTGVVGVIAAMKGANDALNAISTQSIQNTITDALTKPNGTPLSDLTTSFKDKMTDAASGFQTINDKSAELATAQANIQSTADKVGILKLEIESGAQVTADKVSEIVASYSSLATQSASILNGHYEIVMTALAGSLGDAITAAGGYIKDYAFYMSMIKSNFDKDSAELMTRLAELETAFNNGDIDEAKFKEEFGKLSDDIIKFYGEADTAKETVTNLQSSIETIDFSKYIKDGQLDAEGVKKELLQWSSAYTEASTVIEEAGKKTGESLQAMYDAALKTDYQAGMDKASELMRTNGQNIADASKELETTFNNAADVYQQSLLVKIPGIIKQAQEEYANNPALQQTFETEAAYVEDALKYYQTNVIDPAVAGLKQAYENAGLNDKTWIDEKAKKFTDSLFTTTIKMWSESSSVTGESKREFVAGWEKLVDGIYEDAGKAFEPIGKSADEGMAKGVNDNADQIKTAASKAALQAEDGAREALDSHSPSKVFEGIGKDVVDGFVLGIAENTESSITTITDWATKISDAMKTALGIGGDTLTDTSTDTSTSMFGGMLTNFETTWQTFSTKWKTNLDNWKSTNDKQYFGAEEWKGNWQNFYDTYVKMWTSFSTKWKSDLDTWRKNNDKQYFGAEEWKGNWQNFYDTYVKMWEDFTKLWQTNFKKWWDIDVEPFFSKKQWETFGTNMKDGMYTGFKGIVLQMGNVMNGLIDVFDSGLDNIGNAVNNMVDQFNNIAGKLKAPTLSKVSAPAIAKVQIPAFEMGGFPEDGLFYANHNELVGRFTNGQTAVANNEMIVEGIAAGVRMAVRDAVAEVLAPYLANIERNTRETADKDMSFSVDGKEMVTALEASSESMGFNFKTGQSRSAGFAF